MDSSISQDKAAIDKEVDYQYDTLNWLKTVRNEQERRDARDKLIQTLRQQSDLCRQRAKLHKGVDLAVPYGPIVNDGHGTEAFDWFAPFRIGEKIQHTIVYIHGGYWKALDLSESSHWATVVTDMGGIYVGLGYRLAPWISIQRMPERLCEALHVVFDHTYKRISQKIKSTPNIHIHLVGHSAGAQLVVETAAYATKLPVEQHSWLHSVRSFILLSGLYDLRPLIQTSFNKELKLNSIEEAWEISPLRLFAESNYPACIPQSIRWLIAWVEYDSPAFIKQSRQLVDCLRDYFSREDEQGKERLNTYCLPNEDHFSSIEKLHLGANESGFIRKMLEFLSLDDQDV